jgi:CubicO group peptidase (beta-lactamase class C family)
MLSLRKARGSRHSSSSEEAPFNLLAPTHETEIKRLLEFSNTPQISVHFEVLEEVPQATTIRNRRPQSPLVLPRPQTFQPSAAPSVPQASPPQTIPQSAHDESRSDIDTIYAIASYSKVLINVAFARLVYHEQYKYLGLSWDTPACDAFNDARERKGKPPIRRTWGNPEIRQLLVHENGFAPMNRYLFAPDGTFLLSPDEFVQVAPLITEDYYKTRYPHRGWIQYSNGNHIFAALILEEIMDRSFQDLMHELVFDWLNMTDTLLDEHSLGIHMVRGAVTTGYRVSGNRSQSNAMPTIYLSDIVEVASLGARSSTEDLAKLNRTFLRGAEGGSDGKFQPHEIADFFRPDCLLRDGGAMTLGGIFGALDSKVPGIESLSRVVAPANGPSTYTLGRRRDGSQCHVYYKAGCIDGFSSSVYLSLKDRTFVIILGNSSSPVDVTDHVARYILQEALQLSPRHDIIDLAIKEGLVSSSRLEKYECDLAPPESIDSVEDLTGTYQHVRYMQQMTITRDGGITIHGSQKTSAPMKLVRLSSTMVRILPGIGGFGIERWSVWDNLEFLVDIEPNGRICLLGNAGLDRYVQIS